MTDANTTRAKMIRKNNWRQNDTQKIIWAKMTSNNLSQND